MVKAVVYRVYKGVDSGSRTAAATLTVHDLVEDVAAVTTCVFDLALQDQYLSL